MPKKKEEKQQPVDFFRVTQQAVLYNTKTEKFCIAKYKLQDKSFLAKFKIYGEWGFFGGHIEKSDVSPEDALKREIQEETQIEILAFETLDVMYSGGYGRQADNLEDRILIGYVAMCDTEEITLSDEHTEYKWETYEEIQSNKEYKDWLKDFVKKAHLRIKEQESMESWKRLLAEFDNYKKSQLNLGKDLADRAREDFAYQVLPVLDNFRASTNHIPESDKDSGWVQGIMYIQKQLEDVLQEMGVAEIPMKVGDAFDVKIHEAVEDTTKQENEDEVHKKKEKDVKDTPHTVCTILQRGYKYKDKVIRPARVIVK